MMNWSGDRRRGRSVHLMCRGPIDKATSAAVSYLSYIRQVMSGSSFEEAMDRVQVKVLRLAGPGEAPS